MTTAIPTSSSCFTLQLPPIEKDDRFNLNVRTGAAATLHNSFVFVLGGLTIGLELGLQITIDNIEAVFAQCVTGIKQRRLLRYLSGELFCLDLTSRCWHRVDIPADIPKPRPRMFHEIASGKGCLYVFGGLVISEEGGEQALVTCNDLWEFDLVSKSWILLHDGHGWQTDPTVPAPRFLHKLTQVRSLVHAHKRDHSGLIIAGGRDASSANLCTNYTFDMVEKQYVVTGSPLAFSVIQGSCKSHKFLHKNNSRKESPSYFCTPPETNNLNISYLDSVIVSFVDEEGPWRRPLEVAVSSVPDSSDINEQIIIYAPTNESAEDKYYNPLLSYRLGKKLGPPRPLPLHKRQEQLSVPSQFLTQTAPHNLRYPTGGIFGQNIIIVGFLPNELDVSIFIYNKPTGKWLRLNVFCEHDYGLHRFWGGFVWSSHHKVVLLGNYVTSRTSNSMRYFSSMIAVSLPVMNILTSLELAGGHLPSSKPGRFHFSPIIPDLETQLSKESLFAPVSETLTSCDDATSLSSEANEDDDVSAPVRKLSTFSTRSDRKIHNKATFSEYVLYAAPKVKFTNVRSVFPPAAMTLGRNAFERYGDCILDFELISSNGDRIPVCLSILTDRWGKYFIDLLARAYVKAIDQFERNQIESFSLQSLQLSKSSDFSESSFAALERNRNSVGYEGFSNDADCSREKFRLLLSNTKSLKDAPQFRLPFQDRSPSAESLRDSLVDPHCFSPERRSSIGLNIQGSLILHQQPRHVPAQPPLPTEPIPDVPSTPTTYRTTSRSNSMDAALSPRASLLHTLSVLRNIPKLPKGSPFGSPRGSVSLAEPGVKPRRKLRDNSTLNDMSGIATSSRASSDSGGSVSGNASALSLGDISPAPRLASTESTPRLNTPTHSTAHQYTPNRLSSNYSTPTSSSSNQHDSERSTPENNQPRSSKPLLDFDSVDPDHFKLEPSLIPRKLYIPFGTPSLKAFAEFFYTGQVGNKWSLRPCALDCLLMARYFKVPLLYDLICEVLYGIIGRKETLVIKEGHKYKRKFMDLLFKTETPVSSHFKFPLDEFEGFLDTIDDGFLDLALLRRLSNVHKFLQSSVTSEQHFTPHATNSDGSVLLPEKSSSKGVFEPKSQFTTGLPSDSTSESASEDESIVALRYLDPEENSVISGQRLRSIFDKNFDEGKKAAAEDDEYKNDATREKALSSTLESLVSPDEPEPSNYVIDLIYETASMCTDVKLMLRSMNARQMGMALAQTIRDYEIFVEMMNVGQSDRDAMAAAAPAVDRDIRSEAQERLLLQQNILQMFLQEKLEYHEKWMPVDHAKMAPFSTDGSLSGLVNISPIALAAIQDNKILNRSSSGNFVLDSSLKPDRPHTMTRARSELKSSSPSLVHDDGVRRAFTEQMDLHTDVTTEGGTRDSGEESPDNDARLIQTSSSRTSRGRLFGKFRNFKKDSVIKVPKTAKAAVPHVPNLMRTESSASVFSLHSVKSGASHRKKFFGLRKK